MSLFVFGLCIMLLQTNFLSKRAEEAVFTPFDYMRFPSLLMGSGVLVLFFSLGKNDTQLPQSLEKLSLECGALTKGIYFSHLLVARVLEKAGLTPTVLVFHGNPCVIGTWLDSAVVFVTACVLCKLISYIPILKKTVI